MATTPLLAHSTFANPVSQCDQATPCGQCVKSGRVCPGYRNAVDLLFHDESEKVVRKIKAQRTKPSATSTSTSRQDEVAVQNPAPVDLSNIVMYQPWDDLGVQFFMSNYVGPDPAVSQLYYLPTFYANSGYATSSLKRGIIANGIAGYARTVNRPDLAEQSTRTYVAAIRDINTALSSTQTAVNDTTLMSIIMAAMFETMLVSPGSGMHNVSKHLEGAMSVAHLSLQQKAPSEIFRDLLSTLVQSVIMNCWIQHRPLPNTYKHVRPHVPDQINPHSVHARLVDILSRVIEFRSDLKGRSNQSPDSIIQRALQMDSELKSFIEEMPSHTWFEKCWMPTHTWFGQCWTPTAEATEVQQLVYNRVFYSKLIPSLKIFANIEEAYPQQFAGHLWNNVRSCRIHLHQVVHHQCTILLACSAGSKYKNLHLQRSASESTTIMLAEEICATVPQLLSYSDHLKQFQEPIDHTLPPKRDSAASGFTYITTEPSSSSISTSSASPASTTDSTPAHSSSPSENPTYKPPTPPIPPLVPNPDPASAFHLLLKLHDLALIPWLPTSMVSWIQHRIAWIEANSDAYSIGRLKEMVRKRPCDGFPVTNAPGQIPHGDVCETIATTPTDQRLWFLAHSWLFVGVDWNADYYSSSKVSNPAAATPGHGLRY